jgi:hypothetical protein
MSTYFNSRSNRGYTFVAPLSYEGENIVKVPFPVAVNAAVTDGKVLHASNPTLVEVEPTGAETIDIERDPKIQAGSFLIVSNTGIASATVAEIEVEADKTVTLMYDGNAYVKIAESDIT